MPKAQPKTVIGYFEARTAAEKALQQLRRAGFTKEQVTLIVHPAPEAPFTRGERAVAAFEKLFRTFRKKKATLYTIREFQGSLQHPGVTAERARYFEDRLNHSVASVLVAVGASGRERIAEQIIRHSGGDVGAPAAVTGRATGTLAMSAEAFAPVAGGEGQAPAPGDVVRVFKERVPLGDVRVRKEIITETRTIQVPVVREELVIERHPNGQSGSTGEIAGESEIRIPLSEERIVIEKAPAAHEETGNENGSDQQVEGRQEVLARQGTPPKDKTNETRRAEEPAVEKLPVESDENFEVRAEPISVRPPKERKRSA